MRSLFALAVLVVLVGTFPLASQEGLKPHCKHTDKTDPKVLNGEQGAKGNYFLRWTTDADKLDNKYSYVRILSNLNVDTLLPAKWEKAQMEFAEVKALDCLKNTFESGFPPKEEARTTIHYGQRFEKTCEASLYVKDDTDPQKDISKGKELKSTLTAHNFSFTFSSTISEQKLKKITYSAKGQGIGFKIETLTKQLADMETKKEIVIRTKWEKKSPGNVLIPGTDSDLNKGLQAIEIYGKGSIVEQLFQVEIFDDDDKSVAKGVVTAHVPGK